MNLAATKQFVKTFFRSLSKRRPKSVFSYMKPADRSVVNGLEHLEVVYAKNQPQYIPLRTLVSAKGEHRVFSRWTLTPEQRRSVKDGADIMLELMTFGGPLQPIRMAVVDEPLNADWVQVCLLDRPASKP